GDEYKVALYDARFAKPVDERLIGELLRLDIPILTLEDHSVIGGFGTAVLESAQTLGLDCSKIVRHGIPDHWITQDSRSNQLAEVGLDGEGIARMIRHAYSPAKHERFVAQAQSSVEAKTFQTKSEDAQLGV
ncbi:MAG: hypothetical protein JKX70_08875, partial [Phycisphaerales bacterium]|nr:hypothetical protein [Phycisphaerales bacterium]